MSLEFYNHKTPVSQKERVCEMCSGKIMSGEKYSYESGKFYGDFFTRKLHLDCFDVLTTYCEEVDHEFIWDAIYVWWRDTRCSDCKHHYPPCDPKCGFYKDNPTSCEDCIDGRCIADEPCDKMTRVYWCDKYEENKG